MEDRWAGDGVPDPAQQAGSARLAGGGGNALPLSLLQGSDVSPSAVVSPEEVGRGSSSPRQDDWSEMIHEGLVSVFRCLTVKERFLVGAVCKSWRRASLDPGCWREANLPPFQFWREEEEDELEHKKIVNGVVHRSKGQLRKLSAEGYPFSCFDTIGSQCPLLEELRFAHCYCVMKDVRLKWFSDGFLSRLCILKMNDLSIEEDWEPSTETHFKADNLVIAIANGCPQLVSLSLNGNYTQFTDIAVDAIVDKLLRLERLGMSGSNITDASLFLMGEKLRSLCKLRVERCREISRDGVSKLKSARNDLVVIAGPWEQSVASESGSDDYEYDEDWYGDYDEFEESGSQELDYESDDDRYDGLH